MPPLSCALPAVWLLLPFVLLLIAERSRPLLMDQLALNYIMLQMELAMAHIPLLLLPAAGMDKVAVAAAV